MYSRKLETKPIESISKSYTKKRRCGCIALSDIAATKSYFYLRKSTTSCITVCAKCYAALTSKDRSAIGAVAMLEDWITETGRVPRTLRLDAAKSLLAARREISVASAISHFN